ncbi:hypothetical protein SADUNF_Sadunf17G0039200 [Salix dunnii]|uniref:Uncharacterized protein n=1 Tax=Salix dunnii TaxID=1413687 RepID=A0A835MED0_9ROSI|nr:hypothetical protein SADUNF_Sadunf17G0039200 [Salix dunnii]
MIAPISTCRMKCYKQSSMIPQQRGEAARRGFSEFRDEISRGGAEKAWLDLSAGGIKSGAGICASLFDHGCFSTVIANRRHGVKRGVVRRAKRERGQKEGCNTRTSQEVTHPSTTLAQARLTSEF